MACRQREPPLPTLSTPFDTPEFPSLIVLGTSLGAVMLYTTIVWAWSLRLRDSGIMDIFWGPGFVLAAGAAWLLTSGDGLRVGMVLGLTTVWAIRLAGHIAVRNRGRGEDPRYARWRQQAGPAWWWRSWFKVFLLQGGILWFVSIPLQVLVSGAGPASLTVWDTVGAATARTRFDDLAHRTGVRSPDA